MKVFATLRLYRVACIPVAIVTAVFQQEAPGMCLSLAIGEVVFFSPMQAIYSENWACNTAFNHINFPQEKTQKEGAAMTLCILLHVCRATLYKTMR